MVEVGEEEGEGRRREGEEGGAVEEVLVTGSLVGEGGVVAGEVKRKVEVAGVAGIKGDGS